MAPHTGQTRMRTFAIFALANTLCGLILVWALQLWRADLRVLLAAADGDALLYAMSVKGLANGWNLTNPQLGAPFGLSLHDYPHPDNLHYALLKLLLWLTGDPVVALNVYFLLTFPLATSSALFVFRRFGISSPPAIVGSLLFAFLPYHFLRGEAHLPQAGYYVVPLLVMVVLWVCAGEPLLLTGRHTPGARRRSVASLAICLVMAATGIYEAFFAGFFLLVAGPYAALRGGGWRAAASAAILAAVLLVGMAINLSPSLLYVLEHGRNRAVAHRLPGEAEYYGLKITDLLLPVRHHRFPAAAELKAAYTHTSPSVNENAFATLGAVGSLAFLALLARQLFGRQRQPHADLLDALGMLALTGVLFGTMGGFGSLFAQFVTPQIRAYNRISIFLGFFSLFAAGAFLDRLGPASGRARARDPLFLAVCAEVLVLGILDQVSPAFVPEHERLQSIHADESTFIRAIESSLPAGAMVFQLPYVSFPEGGKSERMGHYAHLRAYLHSHTLRLSYPAMRGREGDTWQRQISLQPPGAMVDSLVRAGFSGIYLDRFGYTDRGSAIEQELHAILAAPPIVSHSGRLSFFSLTGYAASPRG